MRNAYNGLALLAGTAHPALATSISGAPFTCPDVLNGTATGAAMVGAFALMDANLIVTQDIAASINFTAQ